MLALSFPGLNGSGESRSPLEDYDFYRLYKTLHVLSVMLLAGGITIETVLGPLLARATSIQQLRAYTGISRIAENFIILPSVILIAGLGYATAGRGNIDLDTTWLLIGQVVFYVAALIAIGFLRTVSIRLDNRVRALPDGPVSPELAKELSNPLPAVLGGLLTAGFVFILYLMVAKPGW